MSSNFQKFKQLHQQNDLLVLPNAWNAKSASIFEEKQFPAVATSSAAVAESLGYRDGEGMPFTDYLFIINRIVSAIRVPLTVDIEMGYGKTNAEVYTNILKLVELGVAGINIEDSIINQSKRTLKDTKTFGSTIEYIKNRLETEQLQLFINIRCDTYLLNIEKKREETITRLKVYETTGADGIFLPCISKENDIVEAVNNTKLPVSVMCIPGLPGFAALNKLGVKRVSMGPFMFNKIYDNIGRLSETIDTSKNFSSILS